MTLHSAGDDILKWRALRSKPKSEHLAARHLRAAEFETFCPRIRFQRRTARGLVWFTEAMFPGYLFVKFAADSARHIVSLPFVSSTLRLMDRGTVPEGLIHELRLAVNHDETIVVPQRFEPGQNVEIGDGPLRGQFATLVRVLPGTERVRILMEFMGHQQEIEVSILSLLCGRDPRIDALPSAS